MSDFAHLLLRTNSAAHRAAKLLAQDGVAARLVPVPRVLGTACGLALRVAGADCERAERALEAAGLEVTAVHRDAMNDAGPLAPPPG
jgi:hypothetical protein